VVQKKFPIIDITDRADGRIPYWDGSAGIHKYKDETGGSAAFVGCAVRHSSAQALGTATMTVLAMDTEEYDTDDFHSTVTNNSRITIPSGKAGYYQITAAIGFTAASGADRIVRVRKNGNDSTDLLYYRDPTGQNGTNPTRLVFTTQAFLDVTDYIELIGYSGAASVSAEAATAVRLPLLAIARIAA
jgi:hypothetical protein